MTVAGTFFILKSVEVMSEGTNTQYKVFFFSCLPEPTERFAVRKLSVRNLR